ALENPLSLQVLFDEGLPLNSAALSASLRGYDPGLAAAHFEIDEEAAAAGQTFGLAGWGDHVIKLVAFDVPMPSEAVESCIRPAHYGPELKERARAHRAHAVLLYAGRDDSPLEQYVALAAVAGSLAPFGASAVLNETARTSFPAEALAAG